MSDNRDILNGYVRELGASIQLHDLHLDEEDMCRVVFDDSIVLNIAYKKTNEHLVLFCPLREIPADHAVKVYERMLGANLFWRETGGATLALNRSLAVIAYQCPVETLTMAQFGSLMEWLVNLAEQWMSLLDELLAQDATGRESGASMQEQGMLRV